MIFIYLTNCNFSPTLTLRTVFEESINKDVTEEITNEAVKKLCYYYF